MAVGRHGDKREAHVFVPRHGGEGLPFSREPCLDGWMEVQPDYGPKHKTLNSS